MERSVVISQLPPSDLREQVLLYIKEMTGTRIMQELEEAKTLPAVDSFCTERRERSQTPTVVDVGSSAPHGKVVLS